MVRQRANHEGSTPTRRGNQEGSFRLRDDGRYEGRVQFGRNRMSFYADSKDDVRRAVRKAREAHEKGLDIETSATALGEYLQSWLESVVRHKRDNTYRSYETAVRVHIVPHPLNRPLGKIPIGKLRPAHVDAWIADRRSTGMATTTLWRIHAILRAGLQRAVKADILVKNPASQVDAIHVDDEEVQPLSQADARRILAATDGSVHYALYALDLSLGLRLGELTGLRWSDVDLDQRLLHVRSQLQRGQIVPLKRTWHRRTLMLSPWLVQVLEAHVRLLTDVRQLAGQKWQENDLLFPSQVGTPQRAANVWLSFQRLLRRAGLQPMKFHNLRHTAASLALQADVPMWKVSKMLGHRDITTTFRIYSHLTPEGREDVAERMEQILRPAKTGVKTGVKRLESASNQPLLNSEKCLEESKPDPVLDDHLSPVT